MSFARLAAGMLSIAAGVAAAAAPTIQGCPVFAANNIWNARVDRLPVHPRSDAWVANVNSTGTGASRAFHMDFGSGLWDGAPIGIPFVVVPGTQPKVPVTFEYDDESDPGPYPIPPNAPIEGVGPPSADGDRHVIVIDKDNCKLYETFYSFPQNGGASWTAGSGAIYNLNANGPLRPSTWTSADAAGLPIFPGLTRYEEVAAGAIEHALRFTAQRTQRAFIWPARHQAGHTSDVNFPPMGARFRLKASYNINGFSPQAKVIAQAMKTYGIILADNGSPWYVSGIPSNNWNNDQLHELDVLKGGDFEAVDTALLMVSANSGEFAFPRVNLTVTKVGAGIGTIFSNPSSLTCGSSVCEGSFEIGSTAGLTVMAAPAFAGWSGECGGTGPCNVVMDRRRNVVATFVEPGDRLAVSPEGALSFGPQSVGTSSPPWTVTVANVGNTTRTVSGISLTDGAFTRSGTCSTIGPGASCQLTLTFSPPVAGGALNSSVPLQATLTVTGDGTFPTNTLTVTGTAEKSLVTHFYRSVLTRPPEPTGKAFWDAETTRLTSLGVNVNEAWFLMANYFFNSPEYVALLKTNDQFLTDVYNTFFNRPPDGGGLAFWQGQMDAGLSREGVIFWFMFSNEFRAFTQGIFGNTAARPEVDMVMDLFRGILNRFPETAALDAYVGSLRQAQCAAPAQRTGAVYKAVNDISYFFLFGSPEYPSRNRSNSQFVSDMYNAFLRRGGADSEVDFWINQLTTNAKDRNQLRADFIASGEFAARVEAVINAGCLQ